ncbi:hypothetical protein HK101_000976 [Irineochytrium annulatum]|nr:hypothetical protein HK101_000976 [Irineochytrium annulatum]
MQGHWKQRDPAASLEDDIRVTSVLTRAGADLTVADTKSHWIPLSKLPEHATKGPFVTGPSSIHLELYAAGVIPDPFVATNENNVQWVGEVDWMYRYTFATPDLGENEQAELVFEGLDTIATVFLNGKEILAADNMFIEHRVIITEKLDKGAGKSNDLVILFVSAWNVGKELEAKHGLRSVWNGDASRVYVRKAQYHWSWDWGPKLITCGPYRPIRLNLYTAKIVNVYPQISLDDCLAADVVVNVSIDSGLLPKESLSLEVSLLPPKSAETQSETLSAKVPCLNEDGIATVSWHLEKPELWWPVGSGSQPLYTVRVALESSGKNVDVATKMIGFRRVRLVEDPFPKAKSEPAEAVSSTFFFEINNTPIFCGGSNWIPADSFLPRVTADTLHTWILLALKGNQNMLRIWGGGIYEDEAFYDLCDKHGILVWQDFMFACGAYPAHDSFRANVRREAQAVLERLRHRPCLVILTGNNEDYAFAEATDLEYDPKNNNEEDWLKTNFPARAIYERDLPDVVKRTAPHIVYKPGSPFGGRVSGDLLAGDAHQWSVWHGAQEPYQNYGKLAGRFISEFGMQASGFARRIACYLVENLRFSYEIEDFIYATQLMQSEAVSFAYRLWRKEWKGRGKYNVGGVLVWQLNDCWPCVSWSIVDYHFRPKGSYFSIRRALASITVGVSRSEDGGSVNVWSCSSLFKQVKANLLITIHSITTGAVKTELKLPAVTVEPNSTSELTTVRIPGLTSSPTSVIDCSEAASGTPSAELTFVDDDAVTVTARLVDPVDGTLLARHVDWPQPLRYLPFPTRDAGLRIAWDPDEEPELVTISVNRPAKGIWLSAVVQDGWKGRCSIDDLGFVDNMVDVVPGDPQAIRVYGLRKGFKLKARYYGDFEVLK